VRLPLSASDAFHLIIDRQIRRDGGPGNLGQLLLRSDRPLQAEALAAAWRALGAQVPLLAARIGGGLRGPRWRVPRRALLELRRSPLGLDALGHDELRAPASALMRLAVSDHPGAAGAVLTWDHRLCDARGAQGVLAALPRLAAGGRLDEAWARPAYRRAAELPSSAALRGRLAQAAIRLLAPLHRDRLLRPAGLGRNAAAPVHVHHRVLTTEESTLADARARAAVGRLSETPFLLAAVAAALEDLDRRGGDLLFPIAADLRKPGETALFANRHGFLMLPLAAGAARDDLGAAARALKAAHREWLAADGITKLLAAISWFPFAGGWFPRYQLGCGRPGLAASCLAANTGRSLLSGEWFGATVLGTDHVVVPPGHPGVAVLFHRDARGLGLDVVVTGALARRLPPQRLAEAVVHQLARRPFPGAP
jgi:hypothetical protein